jgi:hypothetical protein
LFAPPLVGPCTSPVTPCHRNAHCVPLVEDDA